METKMIGNKIAAARKKLTISQAQLAERLFISPQAVGKWERGESMPDILTLNRLASLLNVDLNYFVDNTPSQSTVSDTSLYLESEMSPSAQKKAHHPWDMSKGNWTDADFSGLKNLHEKFSSSNMQRCKFNGSDLSGILLEQNNVEGCDFSDANFANSTLHHSNLSNNLFERCSLVETRFSRSFISGCNFTQADLTGVEIKSGGFEKNILADATLNHTSFLNTYVAGITFNGTLENCYFENCIFKKVTFQNAKLVNTFFKNNKNLNRIEFINCQADRMTYEFLKIGKANLSEIELVGG